MYRSFIPRNDYLSASQQREKMKEAPKDHIWCNYMCQKFVNIEYFQTNKEGRVSINLCMPCHNSYLLAKKHIKAGKITLEQYKENPKILDKKSETPTITKSIQCTECKKNKNSDKFDPNRRVCKVCRLKKSKERSKKDLDKDIKEIESLKEDSNKLRFYITRLQSNKLRMVLLN